jgi:serine protease AprX
MKGALRAAIALVALSACAVAAASAQSKSGHVEVIVKLEERISPEQERQLSKIGAYVYRKLPMIASVAIHVPANRVDRLTKMSFVKRLSPDLAVRKCDEFTVGSSRADVAVQQYSLTGAGVTVAVVDSGVRPSAGLMDLSNSANRILASVSFVPGSSGTNDMCGHGTHVAGIVGGNGFYSTGPDCFRTFYGIARNCNLVNVRVLDDQGGGTVSSVLAGLQWIYDNRASHNIRIVNLSLGHPVGESYSTDPLCQAVERLWKAGIFVVCAAGNAGRLNSTQTQGAANEGWGAAYGSIQSPANSPYAITVGATKTIDGTRAHDRIATYSARGPSRLDFVMKPDIVAPGNRVISANAPSSYLADTYGSTNGIFWSAYRTNGADVTSTRYFVLSGTSMAAPVVSGAAALMLEKDPTLTPDAIKARMMISASRWSHPDGGTDPCTFGAGYLDIPAALECGVRPSAYALSPSLVRDNQGHVFVRVSDLLQGGQLIWGMEAVPDNQLIWGSQLVWGSQMIWGSQLVWGSTEVANDQLIWGSDVWQDQLIWGSSTLNQSVSPISVAGE